MTQLKIGNNLTKFLDQKKDGIASELLNMETIPKDAKLNYIEIEVEAKKLKMSYLPSSRQADDPFTTTLRQAAKPVTVLKKLLPLMPLPSLNSWIDALKLYFIPSEYEYVEVKNKDLWDLYNKINYVVSDDSSTLGNSCMRHPHCEKYIKSYGLINSVSGVGLIKDGLVHARALIWKATLDRKKVTVMDRVYSTNAVTEALLQRHGKIHCDYVKNHKAQTFVESATDKLHYLDMYVPLEEDPKIYPYLDTFCYLYKNRLYNVYDPRDTRYKLQTTEGFAKTDSPAKGYKIGHKYVIERGWHKPDDVVLVKTLYRLKTETHSCGFCQLPVRNRDSYNLISPDDNIFLCLDHDLSLFSTYILNGVEYKICRSHLRLFTTECDTCANTPRNCLSCYRRVENRADERCNTCSRQVSCNHCQVTRSYYHMYTIHSDYMVCRACYHSWTFRCPTCSAYILPTEEFCIEHEPRPCERCQTPANEGYWLLPEAWWCLACFAEDGFICRNCEDCYSENYRHASSEICANCYDSYYFTCSDCQEIRYEDEIAFQNICSACAENYCISCNLRDCDCPESVQPTITVTYSSVPSSTTYVMSTMSDDQILRVLPEDGIA